MGQPGPSGNFGGYQQSDIVHRAKNLHPTDKTMRKLYLIHGTRDDNVHLQHSMMLAKELVKEGIIFKQQVGTILRGKTNGLLLPYIFELQVYPDATHSLSSVRSHFYLSMEDFFSQCFDQVSKDRTR